MSRVRSDAGNILAVMERKANELDPAEAAEQEASSRRSLHYSEAFPAVGEGPQSRHTLEPLNSRRSLGGGNKGGSSKGGGAVVMGASAGEDGDVALMEDVPRDKQARHTTASVATTLQASGRGLLQDPVVDRVAHAAAASTHPVRPISSCLFAALPQSVQHQHNTCTDCNGACKDAAQ